MIELIGLTKRYGRITAVDNLTLTVRPGHVTGFLGPNGAGKIATMRIMLGPGHANLGYCAGRRLSLPADRPPAQAGRLAAGRDGRAWRAYRPRPPVVACRQ
jgi:ABC-type branched-subunit amino acid transport system ATPase component